MYVDLKFLDFDAISYTVYYTYIYKLYRCACQSSNKLINCMVIYFDNFFFIFHIILHTMRGLTIKKFIVIMIMIMTLPQAITFMSHTTFASHSICLMRFLFIYFHSFHFHFCNCVNLNNFSFYLHLSYSHTMHKSKEHHIKKQISTQISNLTLLISLWILLLNLSGLLHKGRGMTTTRRKKRKYWKCLWHTKDSFEIK